MVIEPDGLNDGDDEDRIDPDGFVVASLWVNAAALVLQFVQVAQSWRGGPVAGSVARDVANQLEHLEESLEDAERQFTLLHRTIERGLRNADDEYYDAPFGLGRSTMHLDRERLNTYGHSLSNAFTRLGMVAVWTNGLLGNYPDAGKLLGDELLKELGTSAEILNQLMRDGASNREVIDEARRVLATADTAVKALLRSARQN